MDGENGILRRIYNLWKKKSDCETRPRVSCDDLKSPTTGDIIRVVGRRGIALKSGYLLKRQWKIGLFYKYFVLRDDGKLYYYKNKDASMKPNGYKGVAPIKDVFIVEHGSRSLTIRTNSNAWHLKAKNKKDRDGWAHLLKLVRACLQAVEEHEMSHIEQGFKANSSSKQLSAVGIDNLVELDKGLKEILSCIKTLELRNNEFRDGVSRKSTKKGNNLEKDLDELSLALSINLKNFKSAARRYLSQSESMQKEIRHLIEELHFVTGQRANLLTQVETQAKQLKMIEKAAKPAGASAIIGPKVATELAALDGSVLAATSVEELTETEENRTIDDTNRTSDDTEDILTSTTGSEEEEEFGSKQCIVISTQRKSSSKKTARSRSAEPFNISTRGSKGATDSTTEGIIDRLDKQPVSKQFSSEDIVLSQKSDSIRPMRIRRTKVPDRRTDGSLLWSILKNAIGKELYRIPLPVNFSEPLSFIQRMTENLEYSHLLDTAAQTTSSSLQMAYVAAFVISCWSNTPFRTCKPFNPLWGETFECDRTDDLGWRSIAEQVSHHPPIGVLHADGRGWVYDEEMSIKSHLQATAMKLFPEGPCSIFFKESKWRYSFTKRDVKTFVKGIVFGPLTVHNEGECYIRNSVSGDTCKIELKRHSFFSSATDRTFVAHIWNCKGIEMYTLYGNWTEKCVAICKTKCQPALTLWTRKQPPPNSSKMYNFTTLAIELNEPEEGVAPTDSRLRPDIRLMENGNWDDANVEKMRLEQKQRAAMKKYQELIESKEVVSEKPLWFKKVVDGQTGATKYRYKGGYWKCKKSKTWSACPDLFSKN